MHYIYIYIYIEREICTRIYIYMYIWDAVVGWGFIVEGLEPQTPLGYDYFDMPFESSNLPGAWPIFPRLDFEDWPQPRLPIIEGVRFPTYLPPLEDLSREVSILYYTILYYTILYRTILYQTRLDYTILYYNSLGRETGEKTGRRLTASSVRTPNSRSKHGEIQGFDPSRCLFFLSLLCIFVSGGEIPLVKGRPTSFPTRGSESTTTVVCVLVPGTALS